MSQHNYKIKNYEQKNFGAVSTEFDLTEEKVRSMFEKFLGQEHHDSSTILSIIVKCAWVHALRAMNSIQ